MKRTLAVAAALLLVCSLAAPAIAAASVSAASAPSGMVEVPNDQITEDVPSGESIPVSAADLQGRVLASSGHADSLEVIATTPGHADAVMGSDANVVGSGQMALVFRDTSDHESREVAVDAGLLRQALGFTPETIHGTHSAGETWTSQAQYQDGYLSMQIQSWSSNTVTFSGSVSLQATPATDGSSFEYQLGDLDAASDPQIGLTGVANSETDVVSGSGTSGTISADIGGSQDPPETTLTLSGTGFGHDTITRSESNVSGGSGSVDVAGSLSDTSAGDGATVSVTGRTMTSSGSFSIPTSENSTDVSVGGNQPSSGTSVTFTGSSKTSSAWTSLYVGDSKTLSIGGNQPADVSIDWGSSYAHSEYLNSDSSDNVTFSSGWPSDDTISSVSGTMSTSGSSTHVALYLFVNGEKRETIWSDRWVDSGTDFDSSMSVGVSEGDSVSLRWTPSGGDIYLTGNPTVEGSEPDSVAVSIDGQDLTVSNGGSTSTSLSPGDHSVSVPDHASNTDVQLSWTETTITADPSLSIDGSTVASVDGTLSDGETVSRSINPLSPGSHTASVSADYQVGADASWTETTSTTSGTVSLNGVSKSFPAVSQGESTSVSFAPSTLDSGASNSWSVSTPSGRFDYSLSVDELDATKNPSVDIDRDGTPEASVSGLISSDDSREFSINPSLSDDEWAVSAEGSPVSISAPITETSMPSDIAVSINGHSISHSGTLSDGATDSLVANKSWLREGSNTVSVSIGDGSLSSDAPDQQFDLQYGHSASDQVNVTYASRAFEERYNITHTYASATSDAQVTIPFESSSVVGVASVAFRVNGGDWQAVPAAHYRFHNTTLDAYVADAYEAQIPAGATVDVRATGRKIDVQNGAVTITDPSKPGEDLDTQLRIDERSPDFHLNVGPTANGPRVHYATSSLYPTSDYTIFNAHGDQDLYLPSSEVGDTFRVQYLQTKVIPQKGDVKVTVEKPGSNPKLDIDPGPAGVGDPVEFTYYRTTSGTTYLLNSITKQVVRASGVAHSPVTLTDDDSDELLEIVTDGAASSSSGDGGGGGFWKSAGSSVSQLSTSASSSGLLPIVGIGLVGLVAAVVVGRRVFGDDLDASTSTGTGSSSTLGRIALGGVRSASWAGRAFGRVTLTLVRLLNRGLVRVLSNKYAAALLAIGGFLGAGQLGLVPKRAVTLGSVIALLAGTIYGLRRLGIYSHRLFLLVGALVTVGAVELLSPGLLQQFVSELPLALLAILAAVVLGIWFFFVRRSEASTPETVNRIMFNDNSGGEE